MRPTLVHIAAIILVSAAIGCGGDVAHSPSVDAGGPNSAPAFDACAGVDAVVEAGVPDAIVEEAMAASCLDLGAPCSGSGDVLETSWARPRMTLGPRARASGARDVDFLKKTKPRSPCLRHPGEDDEARAWCAGAGVLGSPGQTQEGG